MTNSEFIDYCGMGNLYKVREGLLDKRVDPSAKNNEALHWASKLGRTEVVRLLLADKRVDPSARDNYAIRYASDYGHTKIVRLLLADKRVDPSANDNEALHWASENGYIEVVRLLKIAISRYPNTKIFRLLYPDHEIVGNFLRRTDYV